MRQSLAWRPDELERAKAEVARLSEALKEMAVSSRWWREETAGARCGWLPRRLDAATKAGLLDQLDEALDAGWTLRRICHVLELPERPAHRLIARRAGGQLVDRPPGGSPMHGLLDDEVAEILAWFDEWGETDRSHRKLAHRGSYLRRVWV